jgi:hypothetical protein
MAERPAGWPSHLDADVHGSRAIIQASSPRQYPVSASAGGLCRVRPSVPRDTHLPAEPDELGVDVAPGILDLDIVEPDRRVESHAVAVDR